MASRYGSAFSLTAILALVVTGCSSPPPSAPPAQRLVDDFSPSLVANTKTVVPPPPPFQWRFDEPSTAEEWRGAAGVSGLTVQGGHLVGQAKSASPVLEAKVNGADPGDLVYEVQVRMRASAGQKIGVHFVGAEPNPLDQALLQGAEIPWPNEAPMTSGGGMTTFTLRPQFPVYGTDVHQILLRPVDVPGARFEIEGVRLIFRREHLAAIPSGVGWHGMEELYHESVVSRSPESIRWPVTLPDRPRLSLALATLDDGPLTFRIDLRQADGKTQPLLERTVTSPHHWDDAHLDLDGWGGQKVTLVLSLQADQPGRLGFWGSPVVRRREPVQTASNENQSDPGDDRPRGVILIMADTLRPDRLELYGGPRPTAPALTRLAHEGAMFRDVVSQGTWTKVSAPVLLTSLFPLTSGVRDFPDRLPSSAVTLAEVYRRAGYATLGLASAPFTGSFSNLHQGYEELYEPPLMNENSKTSRTITNLFLPWLEEHHDEPFFAFLHYFDPHVPYRPDRPYDRMWGDPTWAEEHERERMAVIPFIKNPELQAEGTASPAEFRAAGFDPDKFRAEELQWYDGSIREMDTELERVLERLRELGLDRRTMIVYTSDHGEEFFEHGGSGHGRTTYGELSHVPLIVRYPGKVPRGKVVGETVSEVDILPTMLALSKLPVPQEAQGQSVVPLLQQGTAGAAPGGAGGWRPRPAFIDRPAAPHFASPAPRANESFAVVYEGWKLVWNEKRPEGAPEYELYDHRRDPYNQTNIAAAHPDVVQRLARLVQGWRQDAIAHRLKPDNAAGRDLSPEELERLRSLGYIH